MKPFFLQCPSGQVFVTTYLAEAKENSSRWVIHFPAFAEEMNKSRSMVSSMARKWAAAGYNVLIPDLYGTGDSGGEFVDAKWADWREDMQFLLQWVFSHAAQSIVFWGLRTGCLLAADLYRVVDDSERYRIDQLIFWQPVLNGDQFVTQFLRLRVAASMMLGGKETVANLRELLTKQGCIEVAGYELNSDLVSQIGEVSLLNLTPSPRTKCFWFDVASSKNKPLSLAANKLIEQWKQANVVVSSQLIEGDSFWTTQELSMAPALIDATLSLMNEDTLSETSYEKVTISDSKCSSEQPVVFDCQGDRLIGVVHHSPQQIGSKGVVMVVGGPQYRVGSHRQFVLLARALSNSGIPVLRFDYRGMGDSEGSLVGFDGIDKDISSAIDCLQQQLPEIEDITLWGLCDAATASCFYAPTDLRVKGLVLLNPWVRSKKGEAKAYLKRYYLQRIVSSGFWLKIARGEFRVGASVNSFLEKLKSASLVGGTTETEGLAGSSIPIHHVHPLPVRMYEALKSFSGKCLIVLSGNDLTAVEFEDLLASNKKLSGLIKHRHFVIHRINKADHTFSRTVWKREVEKRTKEWLGS